VNFEDNETRKTGAISYLMYTSFGVSSNNSVERVKFVNAKPVYFPPMVREWGNDNGNSTAWKTAVIRDKDGSFGGGPDSYVLIHDGVNNSIATDADACEIHPSWNAAVCEGDVGRLNVGGGGGGGFGGFGRGGGGPPPDPVILSRNGQEYDLTGTNVRAGTEITVTTERPEVSLSLTELDKGSWVMFELPGFTTAASGTEQSSLDALRRASDTSYFKDQDALWVKVVSNGGTGRSATAIQVSR
jgi:cell migration-inducing and hyaluronan-binding protein